MAARPVAHRAEVWLNFSFLSNYYNFNFKAWQIINGMTAGVPSQ
jgi:hypothetical protein